MRVNVIADARLDPEKVVAHSAPVLGVRGPAIAGAGPVLGMALAQRSEEVAPLAHPGFALDVLDPVAAPAVHRGAAQSGCEASSVAGEHLLGAFLRDRIPARLPSQHGGSALSDRALISVITASAWIASQMAQDAIPRAWDAR